MRRIYVLPLILLLSFTVMIVMAQDEPTSDGPIPVGPSPVSPVVPDDPIDNSDSSPIYENYFMNLNGGPLTISAGEGSDFCDTATVIDDGQGGTQMDVGALTPPDPSSDDPILNCMWGSPKNTQGYRTVWYQFTPEYNGVMTLSTLPASTLATNAYDTILAVHTGSCGSLETLACNDDMIGTSSTLSMNVKRNTTYYIEVADWESGGNEIKTLDLSLQIEPFDSFWQSVDGQLPTLTTRHASVVVGSDIYMLGGRGSGGSIVDSMQILNTATGQWTSSTIDGGGFLNTTAVYLPDSNKIYYPGGSESSSDQSYSREHKIYDLSSGIWDIASAEVGGANVSEAFAYAAGAPNNAGDGYFLTGGVIGQGYPLTTTSAVRDQVLFYQPELDNWIVRKEMTSPRYGHVAANVAGILCVAGGINIDGGVPVLIPNGECASGVSPSEWFPTTNMNVPRYFAHSSVGPDGKWYVYGGIDANGDVVPEVEVFDPVTYRWSVLGIHFDVGGQNGRPTVWPGGGFVDEYLWAVGGSYDPTGNELNPTVEKIRILESAAYLPIIMNNTNVNNHSFYTAAYMHINSEIRQNFSNPRALVNVYKINLSQLSTIQVALTSVADNANLNLYLFGDNKNIVEKDESPFPGANKTITRNLNPGQYYIVVRYMFSTNSSDIGDYYRLSVTN